MSVSLETDASTKARSLIAPMVDARCCRASGGAESTIAAASRRIEVDMDKRLILVRHAKSSWKDPRLADFDRPLNKRGRRDGPRMATHLRKWISEPDLVLCSTSKRTRSTAEYVREAFGFAEERVRYDNCLYVASPSMLRKVIGDVDPDVRVLLLIGHNPGLTELHNELVPDESLGNIPTFGIAEIEMRMERWDQIDGATGRRLCFVFPKMFGSG